LATRSCGSSALLIRYSNSPSLGGNSRTISKTPRGQNPRTATISTFWPTRDLCVGMIVIGFRSFEERVGKAVRSNSNGPLFDDRLRNTHALYRGSANGVANRAAMRAVKGRAEASFSTFEQRASATDSSRTSTFAGLSDSCWVRPPECSCPSGTTSSPQFGQTTGVSRRKREQGILCSAPWPKNGLTGLAPSGASPDCVCGRCGHTGSIGCSNDTGRISPSAICSTSSSGVHAAAAFRVMPGRVS
jgi:hypothetical protein